MARFTGEVVVVTGAGSGVGKACVKRFSDEGACGVLAGRNAGKLQTAADALPPDRTSTCTADVAQYAQVEALVRHAVERFGGLNVMVSNAGLVPEGTVVDGQLADWEEVMAVNAGGPRHCARAALPQLIRRRGCIVNMASVSALGGDWGLAFYNASKGAIVNLTRSLALDYGKDGVRVNAVCPSFTRTPITSDMEADAELMKKFRSGSRWGGQLSCRK